MTQQTIQTGAAANDGTGDPLRTAAQKINANFSELYGLLSGAAAGALDGSELIPALQAGSPVRIAASALRGPAGPTGPAGATGAQGPAGPAGADMAANVVHGWTAQQYFTKATLADASSITWDLTTQQVGQLTLGGNRSLANPSNMQPGGVYTLIVKQDATGARTLGYGAVFKWPGGVAPVLSTAINAIDVLSFICDGASMLGVAQKAFA